MASFLWAVADVAGCYLAAWHLRRCGTDEMIFDLKGINCDVRMKKMCRSIAYSFPYNETPTEIQDLTPFENCQGRRWQASSAHTLAVNDDVSIVSL